MAGDRYNPVMDICIHGDGLTSQMILQKQCKGVGELPGTAVGVGRGCQDIPGILEYECISFPESRLFGTGHRVAADESDPGYGPLCFPADILLGAADIGNQ